MTQSINGKWRGHYSYRKIPDAGSGFEAFFYDSGGPIEGSIQDDAVLGEAVISGTFSFPSVQFTKVYLSASLEYSGIVNGKPIKLSFPLDPVQYEGTMSEDGKTISGAWIINSPQFGVSQGNWTAHRLEEKEKQKEKEAKRSVKQPELEKL